MRRRVYPTTAYIVDATVLAVIDRVSGWHVFEDVLALRLLHAALIVPLTVLSFAIFRRLRMQRRAALMAAGGVVLFPTTMMLLSYVQPDALTAVLTTASLYIALRSQDGQHRARWLVALTIALVLDTLVKPYYGAVVAASLCLPMIVAAARQSQSRIRTWLPLIPFTVSIATMQIANRLHVVGTMLGVPIVDRGKPVGLATWLVSAQRARL